MAYQCDDPRPVHPVQMQDETGVSDKNGKSQSGIRHAQVQGAAEEPVRKGDDDPRPPMPSKEALEQQRKVFEEQRKSIDKAESAQTASVVRENTTGEADHERGDLGRKFKKWIVSVVGLLVGLWVCNIFYSLIHNVLAAQSRFEQILAIALLSVTVAVFATLFFSVRSLFVKLPRIKSVSEAEYAGKSLELKEMIQSEYLTCLPASEEYIMRFHKEGAGDVKRLLERLRAHEYDSSAFLDDFKELQKAQDCQAAAVIKKYAVLIAVKTAASPWKIVDMAAVFFNSTLMICEIARVYNRRVSRAQAFRLLIGWFMNLYVSGELGHVMSGAADALSDKLDTLLGAEGLGSWVAPFLPVLSKFVGKVAEGGTNAYLAYRLGKRSATAFRYLQECT